MAELTTLARPYARAAFEYARDREALQEWSRMLALAAAVAGDEKVKALLAAPSLTAAEQARMLLDLCGPDISAPARNFIGVLADNKRLSLIGAIAALHETFKAEQERIVEVNVRAAFPLADGDREKLARALKARLGREVHVRDEVDESLIGGAVIRAGDLVFDGSVRGRLNKLAEGMANR